MGLATLSRQVPDSDLISAIRSAVEQAPENRTLRVHLASLLNDASNHREALENCEAVLAEQPDDIGALRQAERAARALVDEVRADSYRRLVDALAASTRRDPPVADVPPTAKSKRKRAAGPKEEKEVEPVRLHAVRGGALEGAVAEVERPGITLDDVGGMEQVKRRLRTSFLAPLENPALRRMYGKSLRGGLLLWGPPGCGKTFIARATAGELGARFIAVGLHEILDMWLGESEKNLHELFQNARRNAPCVLFFDEVDSIGRRRSQLRHSGGREVVVQFLAELDSFGSENEGVFVLAATNHPWDVDPALRRPGRLDRMLVVLPPDQPAREAILDYHLRDRPVEDIDVANLGSRTPMFSGADLAHLCESAVEYALEESVESGQARPVLMKDFERALPELKPSTLPWLQSARNYAQFAGEGGSYDELLAYLREHRFV